MPPVPQQWPTKSIILLPFHHSPLKFIPSLTSCQNLHTSPHPPYPTQHFELTKFTFPSLLKTCASQLDSANGKKVHARILQLGLQFDNHIASSLINMYAKCGFLQEASNVFDRLPDRDATVWNAMLAGYFHHGCGQQGSCLFLQMGSSGVMPDVYSLSILLGACTGHYLDFDHGKEVHAYMVRHGLDYDQFLETALIDMYAKHGKVMEAHKVFHAIDGKNVFMWNTMITGFCQNGLWEESLKLFVAMKDDDLDMQSATFASVLMACSIGEEMGFGELVHCCLIKMSFGLDPYVCTSLMGMYAKFGSTDKACRVFQGQPTKGVELWNSMISAYITNSCSYQALHAYKCMRQSGLTSDCFTISNVLSACSIAGLWNLGRVVHGELIKKPEWNNVVVMSSLITIYMKGGNVADSSCIFGSMGERDSVVWSSMIAGFCQNKMFSDALDLFNQMRAQGLEPDSEDIASVASACSRLGSIELGFQVHGHAIKSNSSADVFVGSALIDMYAKSALPEAAERVFAAIPYKNLVVWNSMISGYGRNCLVDKALRAFVQMSQNGFLPDPVSITSVLAPISAESVLVKGKLIHGYQVRNAISVDVHVENALLDMYMKCGCLRYAQKIFERMLLKNLVAWNTMVSGYGSHGHCLKAIALFEEMQKSEVPPDDTTFLSLISSCSHSGLVEEGLKLFESMSRDYGIKPRKEHYANMVDLFGRSGRFDQAYHFIQEMHIEPDEGVWLCLLSACRSFQNKNLGEIAADQLLKLNPEGSGIYTQLLNFYSEVGLLEKAANLRFQMRETGTKKNPGCSWIEVKDRVSVFYSGDSSSPLVHDIYVTLKHLARIMREEDKIATVRFLTSNSEYMFLG